MLLFYLAAGLFGLCLVGGALLWRPTWRELNARGQLGAGFLTAAATSCVVSLLFFALQLRANTRQERQAEATQELEAKLTRVQSVQSRNLQLALKHSGVDLSNQSLANRDMSYTNLAGGVFFHTDFHSAVLDDTNLSEANLRRANFDHAQLHSANLDGAILDGARLEYTDFAEAQLTDVNFGMFFADEARPDVKFGMQGGHRTDLSHAALVNAQMRGACLAQADLQGATLGGANLAGADLNGADLRGARLIFAGLPVNLKGASLVDVEHTASERGYLRPYLARQAAVVKTTRRLLLRGAHFPAHARTGHINHVYDGDTASISHLGWVRLIGLTAPNPDSPYGPKAKQFVDHFFGPSRTVKYVLGTRPREPRWGDTGRWLVYAWNTKGGFINQALLQNGLAVRGVPPGQANPPTPPGVDAGGRRYSKLLDAAAAFAKYTGRNLWTVCPTRSN
jgi:uncharacterized protein YjbI with pentapeptide repeats